MQAILIHWTQIRSKEIIEIIALFFMGAVTGFIIHYLSYRPVNINMIKAYEFKIDQLINHNIALYSENNNLRKSILKKKSEIDKLIKKVNISNTGTIKISFANKINKSLNNTRERNGIFYYNRLGLVHNEQIANMTRIKGIDIWVEEKHMFNIYTFEQFNKQVTMDLERITEVSDSLPDKQINLDSLVWELAINQLYQSMN